MTLLFFRLFVKRLSANVLDNDLIMINNWAYQRKMILSPDPSKQSQEVIFSRKIKKPRHPDLTSNNKHVIQTPYQKHLGMFSDDKLNFGEHLKYIANEVNKSIGLLCELRKLLPRRSIVIIYKSFIRRHIDHGDGIFEQTYNKLSMKT